jgi:nitroreductase
MDAIDAIMGRRVQRAFAPRPVEIEKLRKIVDAGRHAMSARNLQPWRFIIVRDRETLRELGALCATGRFVADAPSAIAVLKDTTNARWADVDCAQAVQNMATAGWSLGIPDGWALFTILPFGYPDAAKPPEAKPLKPRAEVVHFECWGLPERG